jgi:hypothetical protein
MSWAGSPQAQVDQVESLAARIADAVAVRRIGVSFDVTEAVSNVKSYGEGTVMIWFLEDYRDDVVLVVRGQESFTARCGAAAAVHKRPFVRCAPGTALTHGLPSKNPSMNMLELAEVMRLF